MNIRACLGFGLHFFISDYFLPHRLFELYILWLGRSARIADPVWSGVNPSTIWAGPL
jgi:hypothetical protein